MKNAPWYKSLRVQLAAWMTLALLPLGLIAVLQTQRVADDAVRNAETALITQTARIAREESTVLETAFATVAFLRTIAQELLSDRQLCSDVMRTLTRDMEDFSFVVLIPVTGVVTCSSTDAVIDFSTLPRFEDAMESQQTIIAVGPERPVSGQPIFYIMRPYQQDDEFAGFVSVSVPHENLTRTVAGASADGLIDIIAINETGDLLTSRLGLAQGAQERPDISWISMDRRRTFEAINQIGDRRRYTVLPVEGGSAAVLGVWDPAVTSPQTMRQITGPAVFPGLMWFSSLAVVMIALYALVLRHIYQLRGRMDAFAATRLIRQGREQEPFTNEMRGLSQDFDRMANIIIREEAKVEDRLYEREALLREVHHRVKNNLQLISSIMNMQIRKADHAETRNVLERLQDRILSLALIHRDLESDTTHTSVEVGTIVNNLVERTTEMALPDGQTLDVKTDITETEVTPDQAVPLSFMVAEALTNVMKHGGAAGAGKPWLEVSLQRDDRLAVLRIANSFGTPLEDDLPGLGSQLIEAFAGQLGGSVSRTASDGRYTVEITFDIKDVPQAH